MAKIIELIPAETLAEFGITPNPASVQTGRSDREGFSVKTADALSYRFSPEDCPRCNDPRQLMRASEFDKGKICPLCGTVG